jgi:glucuronosyltransferase
MNPYMFYTLSYLTISSTFVNSENILVLSFFSAKSHKLIFEPLYMALAERGHNLTVVSPIKSSYPAHLHMREINGPDVHQVMPLLTKNGSLLMSLSKAPPDFFYSRATGFRIVAPINPTLIPYLAKQCELYYEMAEVKDLLKQKFDLVFVSSHMNECAYGMVHKLNTSFIFVHPLSMEHYKSVFSGLRSPPSYVPVYKVPWSHDRMGILQRSLNFMAYHYLNVLYDWIYLPEMESVYRAFLGEDVPPARDIEKNASLVLMNGHFSLVGPRPKLPVLIDVGGIHCRPGEALPKV